MKEDTIIAISTPLGHSALGVVRLSGEMALEVSLRFFRPKKGCKGRFPVRRPVFGSLFDSKTGESFDQAFLIFFPGPRSYTGENLVEISCHGNPSILEEAVRFGIKAGARLAHPGEFTLRSYENGKMDILQAEAVNDLIMADSLRTAKISFSQVSGHLSETIQKLRARMVEVLAEIEAGIEFPEDGLGILPDQIAGKLNLIIQETERLSRSYDVGKALLEGLTLAIVGRTNVGKSTLFNALLRKERAIVTPFPGTTRDYLKESLRINNSRLMLLDMAGLGRAAHPIDKKSIKKGESLAFEADGLLMVLDSSRRETAEDLLLLRKFRGKRAILVFNKSDLVQKMDKNRIKSLADKTPSIDVSALRGDNIERLRSLLEKYFNPACNSRVDVIFHLRQKLLIDEVREALSRGLQMLQAGYPDEYCAEEIRRVLPQIGELTGEVRRDEVINEIFSRFCVGK